MNKKMSMKAECFIMVLCLCLAGCAERQAEIQEDIYPYTQSVQIEEIHEESDESHISEENTNNDKKTDDNEAVEAEDIAYYVDLVEQIIAREKFLGWYVGYNLEGVKNTDFYIDAKTGDIYFDPEDTKRDYLLARRRHYNRYSIDRTTIANRDSLVWIGNAEVNFDVEPEHQLPDLTENDKELLKEVCDYIYDELSYTLEEFTFEVYLGDFYRGYDDGIEYIMIDFAIVGDGNYLRWVELTETEDGYKIWLFPALTYGDPGDMHLSYEVESNQRYIDSIVSLDYLIRRLEK